MVPVTDKYRQTFYEICKDEESSQMFEKLLAFVEKIPVIDCYADYGTKSRDIEFNMFIKTKKEHDIRLDILKPMSTKDDNLVMCSVWHDSIIQFMGLMEISDVVECALETIEKIDNHDV